MSQCFVLFFKTALATTCHIDGEEMSLLIPIPKETKSGPIPKVGSATRLKNTIAQLTTT